MRAPAGFGLKVSQAWGGLLAPAQALGHEPAPSTAGCGRVAGDCLLPAFSFPVAKRLSTFDYMTQGRQQQDSKHQTGQRDVRLQIEDLSQVPASLLPHLSIQDWVGGTRSPGGRDLCVGVAGVGVWHVYVSVWGAVYVMQCMCGVLCMWLFGESCGCGCCIISELSLHKIKPAGLTPVRPTHFCSSSSELTFSL